MGDLSGKKDVPDINARELIDRQYIIDRLKYVIKHGIKVDGKHPVSAEVILEAVENFPVIKNEILRCKDCKHSEHWYGDRSRCFLWDDSGVAVFDNGFCNYAERRKVTE